MVGSQFYFQVAIALLLSFFIGSVPFGLWIGKVYGVDIRTMGSGNIGATNVYRNLGKIPGLLTFLFDLLKGGIAIQCGALFPELKIVGLDFYQPLLGVFAVLGHCYSPFLSWNGGKGVATSFGVLLFLVPPQALTAFFMFVVVFYFSRYVSLSSISASLTVLVFSVSQFGISSLLAVSVLVISCLVIMRHKDNIERLVAGKENRFTRSKPVS